VTVQVHGVRNLGETSATGVAFTPRPVEWRSDFLMANTLMQRAGEDVVAASVPAADIARTGDKLESADSPLEESNAG